MCILPDATVAGRRLVYTAQGAARREAITLRVLVLFIAGSPFRLEGRELANAAKVRGSSASRTLANWAKNG
jgi:hypothetical protein